MGYDDVCNISYIRSVIWSCKIRSFEYNRNIFLLPHIFRSSSSSYFLSWYQSVKTYHLLHPLKPTPLSLTHYTTTTSPTPLNLTHYTTTTSTSPTPYLLHTHHLLYIGIMNYCNKYNIKYQSIIHIIYSLSINLFYMVSEQG